MTTAPASPDGHPLRESKKGSITRNGYHPSLSLVRVKGQDVVELLGFHCAWKTSTVKGPLLRHGNGRRTCGGLGRKALEKRQKRCIGYSTFSSIRCPRLEMAAMRISRGRDTGTPSSLLTAKNRGSQKKKKPPGITFSRDELQASSVRFLLPGVVADRRGSEAFLLRLY